MGRGARPEEIISHQIERGRWMWHVAAERFRLVLLREGLRDRETSRGAWEDGIYLWGESTHAAAYRAWLEKHYGEPHDLYLISIPAEQKLRPDPWFQPGGGADAEELAQWSDSWICDEPIAPALIRLA